MTTAISPYSTGSWQPGHFREIRAVDQRTSPVEVDPKPEGASQRMAEVAMRVTPPVGGAGPGAESGSRASGLVGTLRGRRHIPGNGGARPGAGGAGRRARAGAAEGRGSVGWRWRNSAGGGKRGPLREGLRSWSCGREQGRPSRGRGPGPVGGVEAAGASGPAGAPAWDAPWA